MTAEEAALTEFREAVWLCRHARMWRDKARMRRERHLVRALARIIRAIRAERTPFHAMEKRLAGSIDGGIEAGIELIKARAYEQGRRDALRGVQGACLFEMGKLEPLPMEDDGPHWWDWEGFPEEMRMHDAFDRVAKAAEEAAMTPEDRRERGWR